MDGKIFSILLAALLSTSDRVSGWGETYRGAVVEYHPYVGVNEVDSMLKNAKNFEAYMGEAKRKGAEIIVFPEYGLFSKVPSPIPDPIDEISPCDDKIFDTTQAVKELSCASKTHKIYSVVNLMEKRACELGDKNCPQKGYYTYNTNVVFDRMGIVRARYAKYNLFETDIADQPPEPEVGFFDTDFGVRFGTFVCFDILFPAPALKLVQQYRVTDFAFSTFWFSEMPFLTALQTQRGWAETNNVNLLAAGMNVPTSGSSGSGIYNGKYGHLVQIMPDTQTSKLLIADIPKIQPSLGISTKEAPLHSQFSNAWHNSTNFSNLHYRNSGATEKLLISKLDDFSRFKSDIIKGGEKFERTICDTRGFCCDFKVTMDALLPESNNYTFRAVVFNGVKQFGRTFRGGVQTCGVVICTGLKIEDCGGRMKNLTGLFIFKEISIKGNFRWKNSLQMPSTLTEGKELLPLTANKYDFTKTDKDGSTEVSLQLLWPVIDLHTFAIWGRDFTRDNEPAVPESSASAIASMPALFATFISFLLFVR